MSTKWESCDPEISARRFARSVLASRIEVVQTILPHAAHHLEDTEHVHQLRVSCRRASAALRAFAPLMRKKPRRLKEWLSKIRDAAGPARDIDVLLSRFTKEKASPVKEYAVERLTNERHEAQPSLEKVARQVARGKLDDVVDKTLASLNKHASKPKLLKFGVEAVRLAYAPFHRASQIAEPTPIELHEFRIAGKRLRYSLEIFGDLFPEQLGNDIYPVVEELQSKLGDINDHATAQLLYQKWLAELPADELAAQIAERVIAEHQAILKLRSQFLRWWNSRRRRAIERFFEANAG